MSSMASFTCPCFLLVTVAPFMYWKVDACGLVSFLMAEWIGWRRTKHQYFRHRAYTERWAQGHPSYAPLASQLASMYVTTYPETHRLAIENMLVLPLLAYIAGSILRDKGVIAMVCLALYEMSSEPLMRSWFMTPSTTSAAGPSRDTNPGSNHYPPQYSRSNQHDSYGYGYGYPPPSGTQTSYGIPPTPSAFQQAPPVVAPVPPPPPPSGQQFPSQMPQQPPPHPQPQPQQQQQQQNQDPQGFHYFDQTQPAPAPAPAPPYGQSLPPPPSYH